VREAEVGRRPLARPILLTPKNGFWKGQWYMARKATTLKRQTFRITEPDATSVLLVGDFTDWQQRAIPMEKGSGGVWTASVKLPLGTHNYLFIVDGEWCDDPECPMRVPNPFGGYNMVREVA